MLFAGQQIWAQAQPVLNQLVLDLFNHAGDATTIVAHAVAKLNQLLAGSGKRDLLGTIVNVLGLGNVWTTIQALGTSVVALSPIHIRRCLCAGQRSSPGAQVVVAKMVFVILLLAGVFTTIVAHPVVTFKQCLSSYEHPTI